MTYYIFSKSKFSIKNTSFNNALFDSFDCDFCDGSISETVFRNSGNDAIDLSGSTIDINDIVIDQSGDKGISVGEQSVVDGNNITIMNSKMGVASKDYSNSNINNLIIRNVDNGLMAYTKKDEYGPGIITINGIRATNIKSLYTRDKGSIIKINGKFVKDWKSNQVLDSIIINNL